MKPLILISLLGGLGSAAQFQPSSKTDHAVYAAILSSTMGQTIAKLRPGRGATVFTFTHTVPLCREGEAFDPALGCLQATYLQSVDAAFVLDEYPGRVVPRPQPLRFDGQLSPAARAELALSFRARNRESQPFEGANLAALLAVPPREFQRKRESEPTAGVVRFSAPGYSTDGYGLVFGSYFCGGLCGQGWLFLLKQEGDSWRVLASEDLWVS